MEAPQVSSCMFTFGMSQLFHSRGSDVNGVVESMTAAQILLGDSGVVLPTLVETFDSMVTDPPAGISFMGKPWDSYESLVHFQDSMVSVFQECWRLLKPGAHGLVWALPRTSHHTAMALERAGFEIRDTIMHLFGQGMPKGLDIAKALGDEHGEWAGWNTTLKPAHEIWWLVRKPLQGTVVENITKFGTGGLNVDDCRIGTSKRVPGGLSRTAGLSYSGSVDGSLRRETGEESGHNPNIGRWPTNLLVSHFHGCRPIRCEARCPVADIEKQSGGDAVHFFYTPKVSASERVLPGGVVNNHPTAKSIDLMSYLVRLITPARGKVLDPFAGSGTTGVAALREGMEFLGVELDESMFKIAQLRLKEAEDVHIQKGLLDLALLDE